MLGVATGSTPVGLEKKKKNALAREALPCRPAGLG